MKKNTPNSKVNQIRAMLNRILNRLFPAPTMIIVDAPRVRRWWRYGGSWSPVFKTVIFAGDLLLLALVVLLSCEVKQ
jgi:hypothetical protein